MSTHSLCATALILGIATSAEAATLGSAGSFASPTLDLTGETISLDRFDPSLGTLTEAELRLSASLSVRGGIENLDDLEADLDLIIAASLTATELDASLATVSLSRDRTEAFGLSAFDGTIDFDGPSGEITSRGFGGVASNRITDPAVLATLMGLGEVDFGIDAISSVTGLGGTTATNLTGNANVSLSVTYRFDPATIAAVPLPAGLPLFALALGALALCRRRP